MACLPPPWRPLVGMIPMTFIAAISKQPLCQSPRYLTKISSKRSFIMWRLLLPVAADVRMSMLRLSSEVKPISLSSCPIKSQKVQFDILGVYFVCENNLNQQMPYFCVLCQNLRHCPSGPKSMALKMETACSCKMLVSICNSTQCENL